MRLTRGQIEHGCSAVNNVGVFRSVRRGSPVDTVYHNSVERILERSGRIVYQVGLDKLACFLEHHSYGGCLVALELTIRRSVSAWIE
jgi:hypothetical protein